MIKHNIKLAFRGFQKDKSTFLINLIGLSTGLACVIAIFMWVKDELGIDKFYEKEAQLYRVFSNYDENGKIATELTLPALLAEALHEEVPEVVNATRSSQPFSAYGLTSNNLYVNAKGRFADDNFFQLFSFEMLEGNSDKIFPNKNGIIISESLAKRFYNTTENVIGKLVTYESQGGTV
ncbi:MAG: ABC transporter permease, partial [Bacteroidota bacterium]